MKKINIAFLLIITILVVALGVMIHYYICFRTAYLRVSNNFNSLGNAITATGAIIKFEDPENFNTVYIELPTND